MTVLLVISYRSNTASPSHKLSPPVNTKIPGIPGISNIKKSLSFKNITAGQKGNSHCSLQLSPVTPPVNGDLENTFVVNCCMLCFPDNVHIPFREFVCCLSPKRLQKFYFNFVCVCSFKILCFCGLHPWNIQWLWIFSGIAQILNFSSYS